eukprot:FR741250.1.p1 GENE.FR741250.1~~FR741250.1.p1  ORF type:complete len:171 (+),score=19.65 FR741250.1:24-515(+)
MVELATMDGQAAGHNYQLMDYQSKTILNVEAANYGQKATYKVVDQNASSDGPPPPWQTLPSPTFHANEYLYLSINQTRSGSSEARLQRFTELESPTDAASALAVLGDTVPTIPSGYESAYTIYRDGTDGGYTLHSALFDLMKGTVAIFAGNPTEAATVFEFVV